MRTQVRHWLDYDSVALVVLMIGILVIGDKIPVRPHQG
jgi:hypothetical protein